MTRAVQVATTDRSGVSNWVQIIPLLGLALVFWFLILRPARRRQTEIAALQESLRIGQTVMTTSGLYGEIVGLNQETVELKIADTAVVTFARLAIGQVESDPQPTSDQAEDSGRSAAAGLESDRPATGRTASQEVFGGQEPGSRPDETKPR